MSKSVMIVNTPDCCEMCGFIDYEPCRCRLLSFKKGKIHDRLSKLDNCPLKEMPRRKMVFGIDGASGIGELKLHGKQKGWNECIDEIFGQEN